jgi:pimeloyl-ACP methyl ester carboxylesterase
MTDTGAEVRPFTIAVPEEELAELQRRLAAVRWPAEPEKPERYGTPTARIKALVDYWRHEYDWRRWEAELNRYPQFTTTIDGATVHFLHVRSADPDAVPLILTHGWPGSVAEFLDIIGPLTDPAAFGHPDGPAFHLVIPSLPGFGWSGPTSDGGWGPRRIAGAWARLMERLGYRRYGAVGNDWGSVISPELGRVAPDRVIGVHVTQLFSKPPGEVGYAVPSVEPEDLDHLSAADREALADLRWLQSGFSSYHHVHATKPLTLGYGLSDSPVGLLAWNHQVMGDLDPDAVLTHVSTHWFTGTAASAPMIYADDAAEAAEAAQGEPTTVPLGLAQFPDDARAIRAYAEREHSAILAWNRHPIGGHYAARQQPALLINDLRTFFRLVGAPAIRVSGRKENGSDDESSPPRGDHRR